MGVDKLLEEFFSIQPYSLNQENKEELLFKEILSLCKFHYEHCREYRNFCEAFSVDFDKIKNYYELPFLPVRIFKEMDLLSIEKDKIFKTMTSSGTTSQKVSRIYLDKDNAILQQKVLLRLLSSVIGKKRYPMLIIDTPSVVKDRRLFSARGAALMSLSILGRPVVYALNDDMSLNIEVINNFIEKYASDKVLIFGMTFMVWQHFYCELERLNLKMNLSNAFLIHSGGWKKLQEKGVSNEVFKKSITRLTDISNFSDHYSMSEQNGSVFVECECGHYHASIFSDIIIRNMQDFSVCNINEEGVIQVVSALPHSYPGNSLLTEDKGILLGIDDCPCGRKGKYFKITNRIKRAEIRGCGDTYATKF